MAEIGRIERRLEIAANAAILVVALLVVGMTARTVMAHRARPDARLMAGSRLRVGVGPDDVAGGARMPAPPAALSPRAVVARPAA